MSLEITHHVLGTIAAIAEMAHVWFSMSEHPPSVRRQILAAGREARTRISIDDARIIANIERLDEAIERIRDVIDREFDRINQGIDPDLGMEERSAQSAVLQGTRSICVRLKMLQDLTGTLPDELLKMWNRINCGRFGL